MVDRAARNRLAELLRRFAAGRLTWCDLAIHTIDMPSMPDPAVSVVIGEALHRYWCGCEIEDFANDLATFREQCPHQRQQLNRSQRREVARWVVFLHSDLEFEWQLGRLEHAVAWYAVLTLGCLSTVLSLGPWVFVVGLVVVGWTTLALDGSVSRRLGLEGDHRVWPFFRQADLDAAVRKKDEQ